MNMFELRIPFFRPLWRRIVVTVFCFGWAAMELVTNSPFWSILFGAIGGTAVWQLFLSGWPDQAQDDDHQS